MHHDTLRLLMLQMAGIEALLANCTKKGTPQCTVEFFLYLVSSQKKGPDTRAFDWYTSQSQFPCSCDLPKHEGWGISDETQGEAAHEMAGQLNPHALTVLLPGCILTALSDCSRP